jgi:hypothetical protein
MNYKVVWRQYEKSEPRSMTCSNEPGAIAWAHARITDDSVHSIWIEDEKGNVLFNDITVRRLARARTK